jgi:hypothetical protein
MFKKTTVDVVVIADRRVVVAADAAATRSIIAREEVSRQ